MKNKKHKIKKKRLEESFYYNSTKEFHCPRCGKVAICGTCGNWWCPSCKSGKW